MKPLEIFEGQNSGLRKAFNEAVNRDATKSHTKYNYTDIKQALRQLGVKEVECKPLPNNLVKAICTYADTKKMSAIGETEREAIDRLYAQIIEFVKK